MTHMLPPDALTPPSVEIQTLTKIPVVIILEEWILNQSYKL